jgi:hypothetical protein
MNDAERALARVTARWLAQGRVLAAAGALLCLLSVGGLFGRASVTGAALAAWVALMLVAGAASAVAAVRVGLDAALFEDLAQGRLNLADLDAALALAGRRPARPGRDMAARCRGARAWWWRLALAVGAQALAGCAALGWLS